MTIANNKQMEELDLLITSIFAELEDEIAEVLSDPDWEDLAPMYKDDLAYSKHCYEKFKEHKDLNKFDSDLRDQDTAARDRFYKVFDLIREIVSDDLDCKVYGVKVPLAVDDYIWVCDFVHGEPVPKTFKSLDRAKDFAEIWGPLAEVHELQ